MNEEQTVEMLANHYATWIESTNNSDHKRYARTMLEAVYNGTYKKTFNEMEPKGHKYYHEKDQKMFNNSREAAQYFGVSPTTIFNRYKRYGLTKIQKEWIPRST
jgi:DNA-binding NtrC family response regulator